MKCVMLLFLGLAVFVCPMAVQEPLSKDDVQAAIDSGKAKKNCLDIGLELYDITGYVDHQIRIFTPRAWVEWQSCQAARNHRDVSLAEEDVQHVLRVLALPRASRETLRSTGSPCLSLRTVMLKDESKKSVLRPISEQKETMYYGKTYSCQAIWATFSLSEFETLRALSPDAEFLVTVVVDVAAAPTEMDWKVKVKHFKKLL